MILDAIIYVAIAITGFLMTQWGSDEAGKFIDLRTLFWLKTSTGSLSAGSLALKLFRSDTFARHKQQKEKHENQTTVTPFAGGG